MTNAAIAEVCKTFFYGAENKMGHLFPKEFGNKVPSTAVALVALSGAEVLILYYSDLLCA